MQFNIQRLSLSPPSPPSGSVVASVAECTDQAYVAYGQYEGDNTQKQFLAQSMEYDVSKPVTGFGIIIGRHGTPAEPLVIGLNAGSPPDDPFHPDDWSHGYGVLEASDVPTADEFYWVTADLSMSPVEAHLFITVVTNADYNSDSYWAWAACDGIPSGFNQGAVWTVEEDWHNIPDTLSYVCYVPSGDGGEVTCCKCVESELQCQTFAEGTICGQGDAAGYPYPPDHVCNGDSVKCEDYKTKADCTAADCYWYKKYIWEEEKCHSTEQNMMMDYLPFIIAGVGGIIVLAALLSRPAPYYPPTPYYPPPASK